MGLLYKLVRDGCRVAKVLLLRCSTKTRFRLQGGTGGQLHAGYAVSSSRAATRPCHGGERVGSQEGLRAVRRDGRKCGKLQFSILDTTSQQRGSLLPDPPFHRGALS